MGGDLLMPQKHRPFLSAQPPNHQPPVLCSSHPIGMSERSQGYLVPFLGSGLTGRLQDEMCLV